ncbi:hypothetical protein EV175_000566 [Coemansia sp. RSA 1933]|nr:hypothetical protein EV175_000566 [Coemansia sp. RSA 1933]
MNQAKRFPTAYIATALRTQQRQNPMFRQPSNSAARVFAGLSMKRPSIGATMAQRRMFHASEQRRESNMLESTLENTLESTAAVVEPAMKIGDLASHGLTTMFPTQMVEYFLEIAHVSMGLPWWGTIMAVTVGLRLVLFPLSFYSQRDMVMVNNVRPDLERLRENLDRAQSRGDRVKSLQLSGEMSRFYKSRGIRPIRAMMGNLTMLPFMVLMFMALRDLAKIPITHMSTGGALWFVDLAAADPYLVLPVVSCLGMLGAMELQTKLNSAGPRSFFQTNVMRLVSVIAIFFTYNFPSGLFVFWITNNVVSVVQSLVMNTKWFRALAKIPESKSTKYVVKEEKPPLKIFEMLVGKAKPARKTRLKPKGRKSNSD